MVCRVLAVKWLRRFTNQYPALFYHRELGYQFSNKNIEDIRRQENLIPYFDKYITLSSFSKETLVCENKPVFVAPLGVDEIIPKGDSSLRTHMVFLFIGRITYHKGLKYLFDAWDLIQNSHVELWLIGDMSGREKEYFNSNFKKKKSL